MRMTRSKAGKSMLGVVLAGGLWPLPPAPPAAAPAKDIEAATQRYARLQQAKDAAGLAAFYTADGELLEPGLEALKGPAAIREFLESFTDVKIESAAMTSEHVDVWTDDALQWGSYTQRAVLPGKPAASFSGRFVAQWRRQPGGKWLIRRLLLQPSLPPS